MTLSINGNLSTAKLSSRRYDIEMTFWSNGHLLYGAAIGKAYIIFIHEIFLRILVLITQVKSPQNILKLNIFNLIAYD